MAVVWVTPLPLQFLATKFGIVTPIDLRLMAATSVRPVDVVIALAFAAAAAAAVASTLEGGG